MSKELALSIAAVVGFSTTIGTLVVEVFGINLVLLLWTAIGALVAIALAREISRLQAVLRFGLGTMTGAVATPFAINSLNFGSSAWSHRLIAALCGALTLLAIQLAIENLPRLATAAVDLAKGWAAKRWGG